MFPDGEKQGLYHTADATLWFFHALSRYLHYTDDRTTLHLAGAGADRYREYICAALASIFMSIRRDGLLAQGH
jgi:glycogen debranching enzyme